MIYKGFTYEISAELDVLLRNYDQSVPDYNNFDFSWSGDWDSLVYASFVPTQIPYKPEIKFSKVLTTSDSHVEYPVRATCFVEDLVSTFENTAQDSGVVIFEIDEVFDHNEPNIEVSDAFVSEGDVALVEICLSEPAYGESLTVKYRTVDGTATAVNGARPIGFDTNSVPFISILNDGSVRKAVFDGGMLKYRNSVVGAMEVQLLRNMILWAGQSKSGKVLFVGDEAGSYLVTSAGANGFLSTIETVDQLIGRGYDLVTIDTITSLSANELAEYSCFVYFGSQSSATTLNQTFINNLDAAANLGLGFVVITGSELYQVRANQIAERFNSAFYGTVTKTPTHIPTMLNTYGYHAIFQNIDGTIQNSADEGQIKSLGTGDYFYTTGELVFEVGEQCKSVALSTIGDDDITGPVSFYLNVTERSHGTVTRDTGTILINDDDVLPCGETASSGGDGVAYFKFTSGSEPVVMAIANDAFTRHDRFDMYKNGIHVTSNMSEIDGSSVDAYPVYDRAEYDAVSGGDGNAVLELRQRKLDRAGASVTFVVMLPFFSGDPVYVDVRAEGPDNTGWDMATYCNAPIELTANMTLDNRAFQRTNEPVMFDTLGNAVDVTFTLRPLAGSAFSSGALSGSGLDVGNSQRVDIPMRLKIYDSTHTVILTSSFAATGESISVQVSRTNSLDNRFFYAVVEADFSVMPAAYFTPTYGGSGQSKPVRCCWEMDVVL